MLFLLPINKLAELTLFSTSGNPNHQIFMLQLCRILFDVLTLKTLERKLFSPWFFVCLGFFFVTLFLFTVTTMEQKFRYIKPGLSIL